MINFTSLRDTLVKATKSGALTVIFACALVLDLVGATAVCFIAQSPLFAVANLVVGIIALAFWLAERKTE